MQHRLESPSRSSFSDKVSAVSAKITQTFGRDGTPKIDDNSSAIRDRSISRGREVYSSGRGGVGNIHRSLSTSRDARPDDGPDDFSTSRGREPAPMQAVSNFSTGRGGAGNIRSPSRDVSTNPPLNSGLAEEEQVIKSHIAATRDAPTSSGRGGAGNIYSRSRSRDPTADGSLRLASPVRSS